MSDTIATDPMARVEGLLAALETLDDPRARELGTEMVQALLDLYGEGLGRILDQVGEETAVALAGDELLSSLLLLHDLHPVPAPARVREALDEVRPYLESHGGDVELVEVDGDVVRVRLHGSCHGCPSSTMTLKLAIEDAIQKRAPEIERVEAEGTSEPAPAPGPALLQTEVAPAVRGDWATVGSLPELRAADTVVKDVAGAALLFAELDESLYAYRATCPGCSGSLNGAALDGGELACPGCGRHFDARRAGGGGAGARTSRSSRSTPSPCSPTTRGSPGSPSPRRWAESMAAPARRLRRLAQQAGEAREAELEHCELCNEPVPPTHRHLLDLDNREVMCACRACTILFDRREAGGAHYRLIPDRRLILEDFRLDDPTWARLRIPVDMAFFFDHSAAGRVVAFYPSPMGPTESQLELDTWAELVAATPILGTLEPDVEVLLVNR